MPAISPVIAYLLADEKEALRVLAHSRRTSVSKVLRTLIQAELAVARKRTTKNATKRRSAA